MSGYTDKRCIVVRGLAGDHQAGWQHSLKFCNILVNPFSVYGRCCKINRGVTDDGKVVIFVSDADLKVQQSRSKFAIMFGD
ncbi:hypothetical protein ADS73_01725 [Lactiplantibacillus plantarum]|nr:hypothetical protein ADS73_01725 [Lactiplantibacillus plantarum]